MSQVLTPDLTYVSVNGSHNHVCFIIDLFNHQILGHSIGIRKDADLVLKAFENTNVPLEFVEIFHTDHGLEFKNNKIDGLLKRYDIKRSLSSKGNPYDNAVSESTFKTFKIAWVRSKKYSSYMELLVDVTSL